MNLESVLIHLQAEQKQTERRLTEIKTAIGTLKSIGGEKVGSSATRNLSAAGRARIVAAQRKRWAKIRAAKKH